MYNDTIPIDVIIDPDLYLSLSFNVSIIVLTMYTNNTRSIYYQVTGVCNGQHPTIANLSLTTNDGSVIIATNIELPTAMYNNSIIRADNVLMVLEDQMYTVVRSLSNLDGAFGENSSVTFSEYAH